MKWLQFRCSNEVAPHVSVSSFCSVSVNRVCEARVKLAACCRRRFVIKWKLNACLCPRAIRQRTRPTF